MNAEKYTPGGHLSEFSHIILAIIVLTGCSGSYNPVSENLSILPQKLSEFSKRLFVERWFNVDSSTAILLGSYSGAIADDTSMDESGTPFP